MAELEALSPPPDDGDEFDRSVSPEIRARLEERYWRPIERATVAESFLTDETFFALNEALDRLTKEHPRGAQLIEMRYFGGMTAEDSAVALSM